MDPDDRLDAGVEDERASARRCGRGAAPRAPRPSLRAFSLAALLLFAPPPDARAAGYSLYEQGAGALGGAGAYTARVADASAVFFNPAGLAHLAAGEVYAGLSLIRVEREFAGTAPFPGYGVLESSPTQLFPPFAAYWGQPLARGVSLGLGVYSPYGLTTEWEDPERFSGRFLSTRASVTPFYFHPAVGVALSPRVRVGAGLMAAHTSVELRRSIAQANPFATGPKVLDLGTVVLDGDNGLDLGFNVGLQIDVAEGVTIGANYRGGIDAGVEGDADFTFRPTGTPLDAQLEAAFPIDQGVRTEIPFPALFVAAVAVRAADWLVVEGDLGWTQWSDFDVLPFRFETDTSLDQDLVERWDDAFFYRFGAEIAAAADLDLRVGYYFDETPQGTEAISPLLPDNDRHGFTVGVGKRWDRWRVDAFGLLLVVPDRSTEGINRDGYEGTYSAGTGIAGLSVGLRY